MHACTKKVHMPYRGINSGTTLCPAMLLAGIWWGKNSTIISLPKTLMITSLPPSFIFNKPKNNKFQNLQDHLKNFLPQLNPVDYTSECNHHSRQDVFQSPQLVSFFSHTPDTLGSQWSFVGQRISVCLWQSHSLTLFPDRTIRSQEPVALPPQGHRTRRFSSNRVKSQHLPAHYTETAKHLQ
jgi:hypothetical protein